MLPSCYQSVDVNIGPVWLNSFIRDTLSAYAGRGLPRRESGVPGGGARPEIHVRVVAAVARSGTRYLSVESGDKLHRGTHHLFTSPYGVGRRAAEVVACAASHRAPVQCRTARLLRRYWWPRDARWRESVRRWPARGWARSYGCRSGECTPEGDHIAARQIYASAQGEMIDGKTWNLIHIGVALTQGLQSGECGLGASVQKSRY